MKVYLVAKSKIDWNTLLPITKKATGRSINRTIDSRRMSLDSISSSIISLAELKKEDSNPDKVLENPAAISNHLFFSLAMITDINTSHEIIENTELSVLPVSTTALGIVLNIVSGSLSDWQSAIIHECSDFASPKLRELFTECLAIFDGEGLSKLWTNFKRVKNPDNTIKLIGK